LDSHFAAELAQTGLNCHVGFMCGIVAYIGSSDALPVLLDGLRRLEYRGYDSAGVALVTSEGIAVRKAVGRIANLAAELDKSPVSGHAGISHTRWATHGAVTRENAHPHTDQSGRLHLVHNGVLENYQPLREQLLERGHTFHSQTDTEVLAHLVGEAFDRSPTRDKSALVEAVRSALRQVIGTYGISVAHADVPELLVGARRGSPLVLGIGKNEHFLASDVSAIVAHTRDVVYLNDYEIVALQADGFEISTLSGIGADFRISKVEFDAASVDKGKFPHYMLKEIHEQPSTVRDAMRGRLCLEEATAKLGGLNMTNADLRAVDRIVLVGCGTAFHAALAGEYLIESLAHIPVECEFASEFRYRNIPLQRDTLVFVISQSGETADTLAALRESQRKGHRTLGICNNVASTIARESDGGVYMHAGPEIGVAATKSFTSQLTIFALLGLLLGRIRHLSHSDGRTLIAEMEKLPDLVARTLELEPHIASIAKKYAHSKNFLFMGRQAHYPIALEGALKLKEISYISASGYPSAELKHGVIALITEETPSLFIAPQDAVFEKNMSNIEEVKARKGPVIAIGTEGDTALKKICDDVILIPEAPDYLTPILSAIPLQILAYHIAATLGCDVDKPRNLAKSVTVE
jgi:glucosamine--fructose-6-phosphate aminotransferase (isomerizing)